MIINKMELKNEKELLALIKNNIPEDTNLEYKDPESLMYNSKNSDIAGDVSAMANSDGGIIIYGICEDSKKMPTSIKWIEDRGIKEKVLQVIQSRIIPQVQNIEIREIPSDADKSRFVLVVNVPKSYDSPHQAHLENKKKRYLGRNGSITRELEHYEVESLFFKRHGPILKVILNEQSGKTGTFNGPYTIDIINEGKQIGEKVAIKMLISNEFEISGEGWEKISDGPYKTMTYFDDMIPCFPEVPKTIGVLYCSNRKKVIEKTSLGLYIICKNMKLRKYILKVDRGIISTENYEGEGIPKPFFTGYDQS